jgi:hypothetical protein
LNCETGQHLHCPLSLEPCWVPATTVGGGIDFDAPGLPPHAASVHITAKIITGLLFIFGRLTGSDGFRVKIHSSGRSAPGCQDGIDAGGLLHRRGDVFLQKVVAAARRVAQEFTNRNLLGVGQVGQVFRYSVIEGQLAPISQ